MEKNQINLIEEAIKNKEVRPLTEFWFDVELTNKQAEIVESIVFSDDIKRMVISCFTRYGKSFCVSIGVLLYIAFHREKRINLISPTYDQTSILRNYISDFLIKAIASEENSKLNLFSKIIELHSTGIERLRKEVSKKRITFTNGCELRVLSAEGSAERLMGWGGDVTILDESCLIKYEVYRQKISRMLGDNPDAKLIEIGNPWHRDNQMYQHWTDPKFTKIHIGWQDGLKEGRITKEFVEEQRNQCNPIEFEVLYEANFPLETEDQLIKGKYIKNALREKPKDLDESNVIKILGVDVARFGGDKTVLTYIKCYNDSLFTVEEIRSYDQQSTMKTVGYINNWDSEEHFHKIIVDDSGLGGGPVDRLKEIKSTKSKTIGFIAGKSPEKEEDKKRFMNFKAMYYQKLAKVFEVGNILLIENESLLKELTQIKYEYQSNGKMKVIKADTNEKSPDFADSLMMAVSNLEKSGAVFEFM